MKTIITTYRQITTLSPELVISGLEDDTEVKILDASPVGNETLWAVLTTYTKTVD